MTASSQPKTGSHKLIIVAAKLVAFFGVVYLFFALSNGSPAQVGRLGAWFHHHAFFLFGGVAWLFPSSGGYWLVERFLIGDKYRHPHSVIYGLVGFLVLLISLCATLGLIQSTSGGGFFGLWLATVLEQHVGLFGGLVISCGASLLALGLMIAVDWKRVFYDTGLKVLSLIEKKTPRSEPLNIDQGSKTSSLKSQAKDRWLSLQKVKVFFQRCWLRLKPEKLPPVDESSVQFRPEDEVETLPPLSTHPSIHDDMLLGSKDDEPIIEQADFAPTPSVRPAKKNLNEVNQLPPFSLLSSKVEAVVSYSDEDLKKMGELLENSLRHFNIEVSVQSIHPGPVVTLFELSLAPGTKVGQIVQLSKDLARALSVLSVRVIEVILGKPYIGIEIPNSQRETVNFYEMISSEAFQSSPFPLSLVLGKDAGGKPVIINLAQTPHLLVAGTTGSGKSVGINAMILSLLYKSLPENVKMILIDPKMLELSVYESISHLLMSVVTDMSEAADSLKWAVAEMERRYKLMSLLGVRNIIGLNEKIAMAKKQGMPIRDPVHQLKPNFSMQPSDEETPFLEHMPYLVIVIDEFADLFMVVGKQIEELIARLAQKARASGIHLILATQRPSVNVITGLIKANIPTRVAFQVSTKIDSRTILDQGGAEQLLGLGDMLYLAPGTGTPKRIHGAFVSDSEVHQVVDWLKKNQSPSQYIESVSQSVREQGAEGFFGEKVASEDELFDSAWEVVERTEKVSISRVQRELRIGYNRAARLIEEMALKGLVSEADDRGQRSIIASSTDAGV